LVTNAGALMGLPIAALIPLCLLIAILVHALISERVGKMTGYPATEWPIVPINGPAVRAGYPAYDPKDGQASFVKVCDRLVEEAVAELTPMCEMPPPEVKWVTDMLNYNVKGGKMNRGLMVVASGTEFMKAQGVPVDSELLNKFAVLGWCIEWMQAWLLVADDIMDDSETRRGQPCWYKQPHVKQIAINDAFFIENLVFRVLKRHFKEEPYYSQLVDLFMETAFQTECGQLLDLLCMNIGLDKFSYERWHLIVKYKTAFYSFYLPVALGMIVAGVKDTKAYNAARDCLLPMGVYFQAQDDFLDCFGTPEQIGKIGTDIQDKKCGWLFVQAYHDLATPEQKKFLETHYGKCKVGTSEEKKIKEMYKELKLEELYQKYEQESYNSIMAMKPGIESVNLPWSVFEIFLKKVYKRSK